MSYWFHKISYISSFFTTSFQTVIKIEAEWEVALPYFSASRERPLNQVIPPVAIWSWLSKGSAQSLEFVTREQWWPYCWLRFADKTSQGLYFPTSWARKCGACRDFYSTGAHSGINATIFIWLENVKRTIYMLAIIVFFGGSYGIVATSLKRVTPGGNVGILVYFPRYFNPRCINGYIFWYKLCVSDDLLVDHSFLCTYF